jgi:hypothetical protein
MFMRISLAYVLGIVLGMNYAMAQNQTTFRDSSGQTTGTATREGNGTTTFRNNLGQQTGTATWPRR